MLNGHLSRDNEVRATTNMSPSHSESELSDVNDQQMTDVPADLQDGNGDDSMEDAMHEMETSESDNDEDAEGSEDAEYEEALPQPIRTRQSTSSSQSPRPAKRKASVDDDDYMQQNPELYGLRRSVWIFLIVERPAANRVSGSLSPHSQSGSSFLSRLSCWVVLRLCRRFKAIPMMTQGPMSTLADLARG